MSTLLLSRFSVSGAPDDPAALVMTADRRVFWQARRGPAKRRFGIISLRAAALAPNENGLGQTEARRGILGQDPLEENWDTTS